MIASLLIIPLLALATPNHELLQQAKDRRFLVSFPRSGQHFLRYCISKFTQKQPVHVVAFHCKDRPIYFTHNPDHIKEVARDCNRLIVIVRNYKESLLRRAKSIGMTYDLATDRHYIKNYAKIIRLYDTWPHDMRLLIYYEDLMLGPENELGRLLTFLDQPQDLLNSFMVNYGFHKQQSLQIYHRLEGCHGGSYTKGNDLLFHSSERCEEDLHLIDEAMLSEIGSRLFDIYLARYKPKHCINQ